MCSTDTSWSPTRNVVPYAWGLRRGPAAFPLRRCATIPIVVFGSALRSWRMAKGWTLEEVAARAGLAPNYVGAIEVDRREPTLSAILAFAKALGITPAELLGPPGETGRLLEAIGRL